MTNRKLSFLFFLGAVAAIGLYFFQIVQPFLLPLLMSGTLALLAQPVFQRFLAVVGGRRRIAAGGLSIGVVVLIVLPAMIVLTFATQELMEHGQEVVKNNGRTEAVADRIESLPVVDAVENWLQPYLPKSDIRDLRDDAFALARSAIAEVSRKTTGFLADVLSFVIGLTIMIFGFYYFLAEGPIIAEEIEKLLPFEPADEVAVAKQFETICRGVVLGTLAAAVAQALLVGIACGFLRIPGTWLLICATGVLSMIPFLGAGGVYVPVSVYLFWNERYGAAIFLLIFGAVVVSTVDNLIRAHMIHGTSRLHPLVALVSALGAIKLVGLWGIFIGPVVAGIFYALLKILQQKMSRMERRESTGDSNAVPVSYGSGTSVARAQ